VTLSLYSRKLQAFVNDRMTLAVGSGECSFETCVGLISRLGTTADRRAGVEQMRRDGIDAHLVDDAIVAVIGNDIAALIAGQHGSPEVADTILHGARSSGGAIAHDALSGATAQRVLIVSEDLPPMLVQVPVHGRTPAARRH
jgi:hypothetical protein